MKNNTIKGDGLQHREPAKLNDVVKTFDTLPAHSSYAEVFTGGGKVSSIIYDHIQGFVRTQNYSIFTVNQKSEPEGTLFIYNNDSKHYSQTYQVPVPGMNHPSGAQGLGDFIALGLQTENYNTSRVVFLNIQGIISGNGQPIKMLQLQIPLDGQTTASVGICDIPVDNSDKFKYVLAASGGGQTTIYISNATTIGLTDPNLQFTKVKKVLDESYEGIQLLTQSDGTVFMIAFDSEKEWLSFKDYIILYKLTENFNETLKANQVKKLHVYTDGGNLPGALKPHCRYGSGIMVADHTLSCYITGRQPISTTSIDTAPVIDVFQSKAIDAI